MPKEKRPSPDHLAVSFLAKPPVVYLGVDVSRSSSKVAFLPVNHAQIQGWSDAKTLDVETNRAGFDLLDRHLLSITKPELVHALVEQTGHYALPLVTHFQQMGISVSMVAGHASKRLREHLVGVSMKSDDSDAKVLAYASYLHGELGLPLPIHEPAEMMDSTVHFLHMWKLRKQLVRTRSQATNRLKSVLAVVFPEVLSENWPVLCRFASVYPTPDDVRADPRMARSGLSAKVAERVSLLASDSVGVTTLALRQSVVIWAAYARRLVDDIEGIESEMALQVPTHEYGLILDSFPGISTITASLLIGRVGTIHQWESSRQMKRAFGFYGVRVQSGQLDMMARGHQGDRDVKAALFQAVLVAVRHQARTPNDFADSFHRYRANGVPPRKALYKSASKLVSVIYGCLKNRTSYSYRGAGGGASPRH